MCNICHGLPDDPVVTSCKHLFCRACINMAPQESCPVCRQYPMPIKSASNKIRCRVLDLKALRSGLCMFDGICNGLRHEKSEFCSRHKCKSCYNGVVWGSDYCTRHKCCFCKAKRQGSLESCLDHVCKEEGCLHATINDYCRSHKCGICPLRQPCKDHTCKVKGCLFLKGDSETACDIHSCNVGDCSMSGFNGTCRQHKCEVNYCLNECQEKYCKYHSHQEDDKSLHDCLILKCKFPVTQAGDPLHKCKICTKEAWTTDGDYCLAHTCATIYCLEKVSRPDSSYCKDHGCTMSSCLGGRKRGALFCSYHKCNACNDFKSIPSLFCNRHECIFRPCLMQKVNDEYCKYHEARQN